MIRAEIASCGDLISDCAALARDMNESASARMLAAQTVSKLAAASALAASAIARLADAETHQKLADAKIAVSLRPSTRRSARPNISYAVEEYDSTDWRAYRNEDSSGQKSTNNSGPRVRQP
jgi:hypothetical protein